MDALAGGVDGDVVAAGHRPAGDRGGHAGEAGTPVFTASAYRFYPSLAVLENAQIGDLRAAISYGPAHFGEHHPDLFFYGVHTAEALYAVLEQQVLPAYYERDEAELPQHWISLMRESIAELGPRYGTARMVAEYVERLYLPAHESASRVASRVA